MRHAGKTGGRSVSIGGGQCGDTGDPERWPLGTGGQADGPKIGQCHILSGQSGDTAVCCELQLSSV